MEFQNKFKINNKYVGFSEPTYIIAEIGQAHDGSLGAAHAYIDIAKKCGVDAVKFQTHFADDETTIDDIFRVKFSYQDKTRFDYWKRMEFTPDQWKELFQHARDIGIEPISTPFSHRAIDLLIDLETCAWKVASGEVLNEAFYKHMAQHKVPILLSSGMSSDAENDLAVSLIKKYGFHELGIFQCTTSYPTPIESVGLNCMDNLKQRYKTPVGLSDHSGEYLAGIIAMARGADILELHLTLDRTQFGPDTTSSLTPIELSEVCRARDINERLEKFPVDKNKISKKMVDLKNLFGRSLALKYDIPAGTKITKDMVCLKKPGTGIPFSDIEQYIGQSVKNDISSNRLLRESDF